MSAVLSSPSVARVRAALAAAGHPQTLVRLSYAELVRITRGEEADLAE